MAPAAEPVDLITPLMVIGVFTLFGILCVSIVLAWVLQMGLLLRFGQHCAVAAAFMPIATILSYLVPMTYNHMHNSLHDAVRSVAALGSLLASGTTAIKPVATEPSWQDVQFIALLLLIEYGFMVAATHLVNLTRYMKISRRRIAYTRTKKQG